MVPQMCIRDRQLNVTDVVVGILNEPDLKWNSKRQKWEPALKADKVYLSHEAIDFYHRYNDCLLYTSMF